MSGSLGRQMPRSVPSGLIGMLVLVMAIERLEMHDNPAFQSFHSATWRYASNQVEKKSRGQEILCFGDSTVKFGVMPPIIRDRTGQSVFNFAVTAGSAPASYFLFRRALEAGARPRAVVVAFLGGLQREGPNSVVTAFPWSDMLRIREAVELAWTARSPGLFARSMLGKYLHSYKDRFEIRAHVMSSFRGESNHQPMVLAISQRNWNRNNGGQAQVKARFEEDRPPPRGRPRKPGTWRSDPVNEVYLRRFLALAAEHDITVYWLLPPFSPVAQDLLEFSGDDDLYVEFVKKQQAEFPGVVVVDGRRPGLDRSFFFDGRHLDRDGAAVLSTSLGDAMRRRMTGRLEGQDWVRLFRSEDPPVAVAVEDTAQSSWHLKSRTDRRRR